MMDEPKGFAEPTRMGAFALNAFVVLMLLMIPAGVILWVYYNNNNFLFMTLISVIFFMAG